MICCPVRNRKKGHPTSSGVQVLNLAATFEPPIERGSRERVIKRLPPVPLPPLPLITRVVIKGGIELTHCMSVAVRSATYVCACVYGSISRRSHAAIEFIIIIRPEYHGRMHARVCVCVRVMIQLSRDGPFSLCEIYRKPYAWSTACRKVHLWLIDL